MGVAAEVLAAGMDIGAGDVHLQNAHVLAGVQLGAVVGVLRQGEAAHVGNQRSLEEPGHIGDLLGDDGVDAGVLEAHGVEHTGGGLGDTGLGIAQPGFTGGALEGEAAQDIQVISFGVFPTVAEGAGGGDDGVFQFHARQGNGEVYHTISSL